MVDLRGNKVHLVYATNDEIVSEDAESGKKFNKFFKRHKDKRDSNEMNDILRTYLEHVADPEEVLVGVITAPGGCISVGLNTRYTDDISYDDLISINMFLYDNIANGRDVVLSKDALCVLVSVISMKFVSCVDDDYDFDYNLALVYEEGDFTEMDDDEKRMMLYSGLCNVLYNVVMDSNLYADRVYNQVVDEVLTAIEHYNEDGYIFSFKKPDYLLDVLDAGITRYADVYPVDFPGKRLVLVHYLNKARALKLLDEFYFRKENYSVAFVKEHGKVLKKYD